MVKICTDLLLQKSNISIIQLQIKKIQKRYVTKGNTTISYGHERLALTVAIVTTSVSETTLKTSFFFIFGCFRLQTISKLETIFMPYGTSFHEVVFFFALETGISLSDLFALEESSLIQSFPSCRV